MVENSQLQEKKGNLLLGLVGAILGALVGAIPWAIVSYFGWFVAWLGFLIGFCAAKGYDLLGGRQGKVKAFIIIVATIIGVAFGQIASDVIAIWQMIARGELPGLAYGQIPKLYITLIKEVPEFLIETIKNFAIGLVFAGLGMWQMIKSMMKGGKEAPAEDMPFLNEQPTSEPCTIKIVRDKSFSAAMAAYTMVLNGTEVGEIKNGETLTVTTNYINNHLSAKNGIYNNSIRPLSFAVTPGMTAEIHFKGGTFKPKECVNCTVLSNKKQAAASGV